MKANKDLNLYVEKMLDLGKTFTMFAHLYEVLTAVRDAEYRLADLDRTVTVAELQVKDPQKEIDNKKEEIIQAMKELAGIREKIEEISDVKAVVRKTLDAEAAERDREFKKTKREIEEDLKAAKEEGDQKMKALNAEYGPKLEALMAEEEDMKGKVEKVKKELAALKKRL